MPISRAQFNAGLDDEQVAILRYLKQHSGEAFTLWEIWTGIGNAMPERPATGSELRSVLIATGIAYRFSSVLDRLAKEELILIKRTNGDHYYAINPALA